MIVVDFPAPKNDKAILKVEGHSFKALKGEDIVCSAVSALAQTFAGGVQNNLGAKVTGKLESGDCHLEVSVTPENFAALKLVYRIFRFGFQKIQESYPEQVKLI
jgi:uncharacterized protein YsxB (DUF464 family)